MEFERRKRLAVMEERLGYAFKDLTLLDMALTHTSYVKGDGRARMHNERLEFLGDAVLELCASEYLYKGHPDFDEGEMTVLRAASVCEGALYEAAKPLGIGDALLLGRGEEHTGGREKPSIVSDALEAVIGALYLDGGMETARNFIMSFIDLSVKTSLHAGTVKDYKTMLQEHVQKRHMGVIAYRLSGSTGPDHNKVFTMEVSIAGAVAGTGEGRTKQEAGQHAARAALASFGIIESEREG